MQTVTVHDMTIQQGTHQALARGEVTVRDHSLEWQVLPNVVKKSYGRTGPSGWSGHSLRLLKQDTG